MQHKNSNQSVIELTVLELAKKMYHSFSTTYTTAYGNGPIADQCPIFPIITIF